MNNKKFLKIPYPPAAASQCWTIGMSDMPGFHYYYYY
jgi:hypothetical protein